MSSKLNRYDSLGMGKCTSNMIREYNQSTEREHQALEVPMGWGNEKTSGRFVSSRTMYQIRARILKKLSVRMKSELRFDAGAESVSPGLG